MFLGTEFQANTYTSNEQSEPAVAALAGGGFVTVWNSRNQDGSYLGAFGQRFDASGGFVGTEFQVNTYTSELVRSIRSPPDSPTAASW